MASRPPEPGEASLSDCRARMHCPEEFLSLFPFFPLSIILNWNKPEPPGEEDKHFTYERVRILKTRCAIHTVPQNSTQCLAQMNIW